jgi:hypothetical protein
MGGRGYHQMGVAGIGISSCISPRAHLGLISGAHDFIGNKICKEYRSRNGGRVNFSALILNKYSSYMSSVS